MSEYFDIALAAARHEGAKVLREIERREISNENWRLLDLKLDEMRLAIESLNDQVAALRRELRGNEDHGR